MIPLVVIIVFEEMEPVMKKWCYVLGLLVCHVLSGIAFAQDHVKIEESIQKQSDIAWSHAQQIWDWAEPGYQETKSTALLSNWMEENGFRIKRGLAGIPTGFTAEFGEGKPVIAILGEFDALPGLAQSPVPHREEKEGAYYGHGCGHHLFGVASGMAAIAVAEEIRAGRLKGTIRYYGCPAEEGGSAKVFFVRAGLFNDVDTALHWHPSNRNSAGDRSSLARIAVKFRFHGKSAHAAGAPEQGRSALDAVELMNHAVQLLREHVPESTRIHHIITSGGDAPNVVPNYAEVYYYVRHPKSRELRGIYDRVVKCAEAGALATGTRLEIVNEGGILELLPNNSLAEVMLKNLRELNDLKWTKEELEFAVRLQESLDKPESLDSIHEVQDRSGTVGNGSTDVGDVSWVVPTTGFGTACWVPGTPGHSWQAVTCGKQTFARKGMILAARVLATTTVELFQSPDLIKSAQAEHRRRLGEQKYETLMAPDQQPALNYRHRKQ